MEVQGFTTRKYRMKVKTDSEVQFTVTITGSKLEMQVLLDVLRNPSCDPADEPEMLSEVRRKIFETIHRELKLDGL